MSEKQHYRLVKKIKDDLFNVDDISTYNLYLQISHQLFRFCITDSEKNRCLHLEDYRISGITHPDQLIQQLEKLYDEHHLLKAGFWKSIRLAVKNVNFSLVPNSLFDKNFLREYVSINSPQSNTTEEGYYYYAQKSTDAVNIFSADKKIIDWFCKVYPSKNIRVVHYTSSLIEGVMMSANGAEQRQMFLQVEQNYLTIIVKHNKTLEFCNTFYFYTAEDFIYFVMFVFDQLQLSQEETEVVVWGEITHDSLAYNKLVKYIRNVSLGEKPSALKFGYTFDEIMDHNFFDLYSMHLCE
ncbi:MAG: DUF3822 family protein [Cytophagaceae bacterium]|nr:DUF3822 family protein [Cytophagaceae bacterium]MDW8456823.1 DUF3822 family protein [Cytophagaceae bacterium]